MNWSGYSNEIALFAGSITVPTVALDLVIFWATVLRRSGRRATSGTQSGRFPGSSPTH